MTTRRPKLGMIVLVVLVTTVWLAVMVWIALQPERTEGNLGIDDETNDGAGAITSVLEDHGIAVRPAQSMTQLRSELQRRPDAIVMFHDPHSAMETASYERLEQLADLVPAEQRVFAGVSAAQQQYLLDGVDGILSIGFADRIEVETTCQLPAAREAGEVSGIRTSVVLDDTARGCFGVTDETTGEAQEAYAFAETSDGTVLFADWRMLSNAGLYDNGTATLATWALGRSDTVIWFQPDFQFDPDTDGQLSPVQYPDWVRMSIVWAVIVAAVYLAYRGRRTGPVVVEPLPTEVPAAETTVGRGRMYARAKHQRHALEVLQRASLARLARDLQLGPQTSDDAVLAETATQLNLPLDELRALYAPAEQLTDTEFVHTAAQLQDLEHRVRDRFGAPTKES